MILLLFFLGFMIMILTQLFKVLIYKVIVYNLL